MYAAIRNKDTIFQAGDYVLNQNMSYDQLIVALKTGDTIKEEVTITFIEGITVREMADLLEENKVCGAQEFLRQLDEASFGFEFEDMLGRSDLRFRPHDGYLSRIPMTFMLGRMWIPSSKADAELPEPRVPRTVHGDTRRGQNPGRNGNSRVHHPEGAGSPEEMKRVSSVFHNRLNAPGMYRTCSPT
jgi:UPF0755 protein